MGILKIAVVAAIVLAFLQIKSLLVRIRALETKAYDQALKLDEMETKLTQETQKARGFLEKLTQGREITMSELEDGRLYQRLEQDACQKVMADDPDTFILDVRSPREFEGVRIPGAVLIPEPEVSERMDEIPKDAKNIVVHCAHGIRSLSACEYLASQGYTNLINMEGGISVWTGATEQGPVGA